MDIKFHVNKIIDNGSRIDDWAEFVEKLKQQKCDRDLLLQIITIALNNTCEKSSKQYKKLLVGLANLQSEVSPETARQTYIDANSLDPDCAVVCVYHAQFEHCQKRKNEATSILRNGKTDGRTPKVLIKNAYHNLRDNKWNLFEGVIDPWDDSLYDITATATIKSGPRSPTNNAGIPIGTNYITSATKSKMFAIGKPTRSASSLLRESTPKSPIAEVKEKLGLIDSMYPITKSRNSNSGSSEDSKRFCTKEKAEETDDQIYRPTLSPFTKTENTPHLLRKKEKSSYAQTPVGFVYNIFASGSSVNIEKKTKQFSNKVIVDDIVTSLNFDAPPGGETKQTRRSVCDPMTDEEIKQNCVQSKDASVFKDSSFIQDTKPVFERLPNKPPDKFSGIDNNFFKQSLKTKQLDNFRTPMKDLNLNNMLVQRTCPKKPLLPGSSRKPLTEIKLVKSKSETDAENIRSKKQRLDFNKTLSTPGISDKTLPNSSCKKNIEFNKTNNDFLKSHYSFSSSHEMKKKHTGLTELLNSVAFDDDCKEINKTDVIDQKYPVKTVPIKGDSQRTITSIVNIATKSDTRTDKLSKTNHALNPLSNLDNDDIKAKSVVSRFVATDKKPNVQPSERLIQNSFSRPSNTTEVTPRDNIPNVPLQGKERHALSNLKNIESISPPSAQHGFTQNGYHVSSSVPAKYQQSSQKVDEQPLSSLNVNVNQLVQNGLDTLGMSGFNMDNNLQDVPQKSKTFILNKKVYKQVKCIGKGGFCKVYDVVDATGSTFALKKVKLDDLDAFLVECNMNEIKLLTSLKGNPVIIQLYDWEKTEDNLLLLLEKGDRDLARTLKKFEKVPLEKIKEYWAQMLKAVKVIHDKDIVHADLKPANFLFVGASLKLIDFGISNSLQSNKTSITREYQLGTLNYMPPEALMADVTHENGASRISRGSDVWSLGCMLYLMVFNKTPYQHITNGITKTMAIQKGDNINYDGIKDPNLLDCLKGCLKYNKRERYTIEELLNHAFLKQSTD